ncbi:major facilitator superfamily domain-containing protein [Clohesyomyces aquaticus]|uniref:Major facilitator superfamily domain-containing protein n=1 Tax=Clohesyomyces aquaticus TaxID=1231657 RepID=A0A1Y1ZMA6_9PLEO|nr:major facilitator superfamily domain-containing protein [Clohesyomyces aquaticus]
MAGQKRRLHLETVGADVNLDEMFGDDRKKKEKALSIFFVGYILTQIPTNMILSRTRPSIFFPCIMCMWAAVSAATGTVQSYQGMIALRFVLGFRELAKRISILYAAGQMSGAFGGLLGSAVMAGMARKAGLPAWRWLFIIEGVATFPIALEPNQEDNRSEATAWQGLCRAFTDPALYLIWFMQLGLNTTVSLVNFFPTIVATMGYPRTETLLLSAPPYVFAAVLGIANSWHSDKTKEPFWHVVWPQVFCSIGFIISAITMNNAARYTATFMMISVYGSSGCILSWVSTSLPRPPAKRAVAYAVVNAGSNMASIYASHFYPKTQGPRHWQANVANVAFSGACIVLTTILRIYLSWRNKQLNKAMAENVSEGSAERDDGGKAAKMAAK